MNPHSRILPYPAFHGIGLVLLYFEFEFHA